jgi:hypothetical protein
MYFGVRKRFLASKGKDSRERMNVTSLITKITASQENQHK